MKITTIKKKVLLQTVHGPHATTRWQVKVNGRLLRDNLGCVRVFQSEQAAQTAGLNS